MSPAALLRPPIRPLVRADLPAIWRVRYAVQENKLTPGHISDEDVIERLEQTGQGWGIEVAGELVAFAIACTETTGPNSGRIWALFVLPEHATQGHGRRLHDEMVASLWGRGLRRLWLNTEPGSRAETFYRLSNWIECGRSEHGEIRFELPRPATLNTSN